MKKIILLCFVFYSSFSQNLLQETIDIQNDAKRFFEIEYKKMGLAFNPPMFVFSNDGYNIVYSALHNQVITSPSLLLDLYKKYSNSAVFFTYAHELGHFVQSDQNRFALISIMREYTSDCIGGVYFSFTQSENRLESNDVRNVVRFLNDYTEKDVKLKDIFTLDSHGSAQGRINAFLDGFKNPSINYCLDTYGFKK